jgi:energy-coupling factor transport system ATP-binding protein
MNEEKYIIKTEDLSFTYFDGNLDELKTTEIPALRSINLSVKEGEYISVLGHNGSGKSTLAKLLNLILIPTSGKIYIDGKDVSDEKLSDDEVFEVRKKVGMVFQNPDNQIVATVVEEDVAFGVENLGLPREEIRRRVVNALNVVGMQDYARHAPHKLSGGQKQRVAIAGIIAMRPRVIIFDESTAMLDPIGRKAVIEIMEKLNREENITVINITHYMEEAARADRVIVINDGEMILDGTAKEVFSEVDLLHKIGLESPQSTELVKELKRMGLNVDIYAIGEEECVDTIFRSLSEKGYKLK